jgi:WD40 repeat protein
VLDTEVDRSYRKGGHGDIRALTLLPAQGKLVCSIGLYITNLLDVDSRKESHRFSDVESKLSFVASEANWLAIKPRDKSIEVYEISREARPKRLGELAETERVTSGVLDERGRWFVGVRDDALWRWQLQRDGGALTATVEEMNEEGYGSVRSVTHVCTDAGGSFIAVAGVAGEEKAAVDIWDAKNWSYKRSSLIHERGFIDAITLTRDGNLLAVGGGRFPRRPYENIAREELFTVRIASTDDLREYQLLRGHRERVLSLHFSEDGKYLASGSADKSAIIWKLRR